MSKEVKDVVEVLRRKRFNLHDEKILQSEMEAEFVSAWGDADVEREFVLDHKNTIDFLISGDLGVEVKIGGQKRAIYKQCERYCGFEKIKVLLLVTNRSMGFPEQINGKDCYVLNLGRAWL
jgi:hypothetical protein